MAAPQYKVNVHIASVLSMLGLPTRGEEVFVSIGKERRKIADFVLMHSIAGNVIGEAEIGDYEYDQDAKNRLEQRARERFSDIAFRGFDFIMLLIYPRKLVEDASKLHEHEIDKVLMERTVGLGIAARGEAFGLLNHYFRWYDKPVKVLAIPQTLDIMIGEFFEMLRKQGILFRTSQDLVGGILNIIENTAKVMSLSVRNNDDFIKMLADAARGLNIAWDHIKTIEDRIEVTVKFMLLLTTLIMIFYEIVRAERLPRSLGPIECNELSINGLIDLFEKLISEYKELDEGFIEVLRRIPAYPNLDSAVQGICREVKQNLALIRRLGWDVLSMLYQRLLSETYRHAFATFYTKLPAARLLAALAVDKFDDKVIDPACGTGSLLLATVERRRTLLTSEQLKEFYIKSIESNKPILDLMDEEILRRTYGLDALKPASFIAALNLRIATRGSPPDRLQMYNVAVGTDNAGSLDLLTSMRNTLAPEIRSLVNEKFDVVIMNPPFTRSDRISFLIGENARNALLTAQLSFGGVAVENLFAAGMAKPFMVLADRLVREGGRIAAVLPNSILSRPAWEDIRQGLLQSYDLKYLVISWAQGTPNFSSDTRLREILFVARKRPVNEAPQSNRTLKVINLYKRVDDLTFDEIEKIVEQARDEVGSIVIVTGRNASEVIASIIPMNFSEKLADNLYRLIAFKNGDLLKMHLDIVTKCSIRFGDVFNIGSVVDHTAGIRLIERGAPSGLQYVTPAVWGSGENLEVKRPWIDKAPFMVGVENPDAVKVKYWRRARRDAFYSARLFVLRRGRLGTQFVLMIRVNEDSISNVWWPLEPIGVDENVVTRYLVYMNSIFGFINFLGERLETEGLYVEYKKEHLHNLRIPDLRSVGHVNQDVIQALTVDMPRFDAYIEFMSKRNRDGKWYEAARSVIEESGKNPELKLYANRALLDLEAYKMLNDACSNVYVPDNLYVLLREEIEVLRQIMEREDDEDIIEDIPKRVGKETKSIPLTKWME